MEDNMEDWLAFLLRSSYQKIAFLLSTKSTTLVPWHEWILSYTRILGIPQWNSDSFDCVLKDSPLENSIKKILITIHLK